MMEESLEKSTELLIESNLTKGRSLVIVLISILIGMDVLSIIFYIATIGIDKIATQIIRFILTCILCLYIYKGHSWAKWVAVVLFTIAFLVGLYNLISANENPIVIAVSSFYIIMYGLALVLLLVPKSVKEFLEHQKIQQI